MINKEVVIIHIITRPDKGGAEFLVRELYKYLKKKGFNINVIYFTNPSKVNLYSNEYCLNFKSPADLRIIWYLRKKIKKIVKKNFSIIHSHLSWPLYFLPLSYLDIKSKYLYTEHNTYNKRRKFLFLKFFEKYIYNKFFRVICVSKAVKISLIKWLGVSNKNKKIIVIPNGVRLFSLTIRRKNKNRKIQLISIGSLTEQKGFDVAINAISLIKDKVESYTILGEGVERKKLLALAEKRGVRDKLIIPGYVENIEKYLVKAELGLIPSRWEGFRLTSIEMLSTGLPIISSNIPGLAEVVGNCPAVKLVKPEDSEALALCIEKTIINNRLKGKKKIALQARKHAKKFCLETMCQNYVNIYKNISK